MVSGEWVWARPAFLVPTCKFLREPPRVGGPGQRLISPVMVGACQG